MPNLFILGDGIRAFLIIVVVLLLGSFGLYQESFAKLAEDEKLEINQSYTRPTFGLNHENNKKSVDNGFNFNDQTFSISDNFHTPFREQEVNIGEVNLFEAKVYAERNLKVQEFLFGIPNKGEAHLAELGIEVWYDMFGQIYDTKVIQKSNVIDVATVNATHEKVKCRSFDKEENCDVTKLSMIFLEPLKDKVMALKAIDYKNRYQITYLNDGFDISGESLNPMASTMILSTIRNEGMIQVTQTEKYNSHWTTEDGRMFERNNFGSFKQINQTFERFQDVGEPRTRQHSEFGGIIAYEQERATAVFDSSKLISELPESKTINMKPSERIDKKMKDLMAEQEKICQKFLVESEKQTRHY